MLQGENRCVNNEFVRGRCMSTDTTRRTTMNSVDRALGLLRHFSVQTPEYGLSALARVSGNDKTTTLRCLTALERNGIVEQHPETKKYRIGFAPLHLSRIREKSFVSRSCKV